MTPATSLSRRRLAALLAMTALVYALEMLAVRRLAGAMSPRALTAVVTFDLALVVPFAWWLFGLRGVPGGARRLLPIVLASLAGAALVVPGEGRSLVSALRFLLLPLELVVLVVTVRTVASAVRLARASTDMADALEAGLSRALGENAMTRLLAAEASAVFYLVARSKRGVAASGRFTLEAARSPVFTFGLSFVTILESIALHVVLAPAHPAIAWVLTGLSAYAVLWLLGQDRALAARTIDVETSEIVLRSGLRLSARVPWSSIASTEIVSWSSAPAKQPGYLDAARPTEPNVVLRFHAPVRVTGLFGIQREISMLGLAVDDPDGLKRAIDAARASPSP
jgi:hypothetical protein